MLVVPDKPDKACPSAHSAQQVGPPGGSRFHTAKTAAGLGT
jgi:hypothetical protein